MTVTADVEELPELAVAARLDRLRDALAGAGLHALVVTRLPNVRYLTGFTGSAGLLLVGPEDACFVTDGRYGEQAELQLRAAGVRADLEVTGPSATPRDVLTDRVRRLGRVALEAHGVTWAQQRSYAEWFEGVELEPAGTLVEDLRRVKEPAEVARIGRACAVADDALAELLPRLADGPTERELALELEVAMRRRGASGTSFDPIVASGPNASRPHARPTDRRIGSGELVVLDFGCVVDGYCSDMTRTVSVGDPGPEARRLVDVVVEAQRAGRDAVAAGVECRAVDAACRDVIDAAGLGRWFVHSTGHGVGLEIHEAPRVAGTVGDTLAPGYVVTVEPGVYVPGTGGVRVEDTVVVTSDGATALTEFPKDLVL